MKIHPDCEEHGCHLDCQGECEHAEEDFDDKRPIFEERDTDQERDLDRRARARECK